MSSYDHNLLDEAPRATRTQLQEGYNVDLLEQPPRHTPPPQTQSVTPFTSGIAQAGSGEKFDSVAAPKSRTSFWRSRSGVITISIVALVVIAAVVGGAVGGTVNKSSNKSVGTTGTHSTTSSDSSLSVTKSTSASATNTVTQGMAGGSTAPASTNAALATGSAQGIANTVR